MYRITKTPPHSSNFVLFLRNFEYFCIPTWHSNTRKRQVCYLILKSRTGCDRSAAGQLCAALWTRAPLDQQIPAKQQTRFPQQEERRDGEKLYADTSVKLRVGGWDGFVSFKEDKEDVASRFFRADQLSRTVLSTVHGKLGRYCTASELKAFC